MKKIFLALVLAFTLTGCDLQNMDNTPTKKVEAFFDKYQTLDSNVLNDLDLTIADDTTIDETTRSGYREFMKNHYQDLEYEIKDETIDGDNATVVAEVTVRDYSKVLNDADVYRETNATEFNDETGSYSPALFSEYRLNKMKDVAETVTYTLNLTLTKQDDEWVMDELSEIDEQKMNGLYDDGTYDTDNNQTIDADEVNNGANAGADNNNQSNNVNNDTNTNNANNDTNTTTDDGTTNEDNVINQNGNTNNGILNNNTTE